MCVLYSTSVIPPLPISSMSGSFQWPTCEYFAQASCPNPMRSIDAHRSWMSPVVRHRLPPAFAAHSPALFCPYWQRAYTIGRPVSRSATAIFW
jgi:hypothetical protein